MNGVMLGRLLRGRLVRAGQLLGECIVREEKTDGEEEASGTSVSAGSMDDRRRRHEPRAMAALDGALPCDSFALDLEEDFYLCDLHRLLLHLANRLRVRYICPPADCYRLSSGSPPSQTCDALFRFLQRVFETLALIPRAPPFLKSPSLPTLSHPAPLSTPPPWIS